MIKVVLLGAGNVAQHLIKAFEKSPSIELLQVWARTTHEIESLVSKTKITTDIQALVTADVYIIAVSDKAIEEVSNQLSAKNALVVHTSGSLGLNVLSSHARAGVFYPLQTFSKHLKVDFSTIPICLEATTSADLELLKQIAGSISKSVHFITSEQRKALHIAAVFVCNFVNHLYQQGEVICKENNLDFALLKPLIQETAHKILELSPAEAQTGPAKREDMKTIENHLQFITDAKQRAIYTLMTQSIIDYGKKL